MTPCTNSFPGTLSPVVLLAALAVTVSPLGAQTPDTASLPGHVIRALERATRLPHTSQMDDERITVTVVLRLSDPQGARALAADYSNPASLNYGRAIGLPELSARFGPSQDAWNTVLAYLQQHGLTLSNSALDRVAMTVTGTRAQVQKAFNVAIDNYQLGDRTFHAVARDPVVPAAIAPYILCVTGLSNLARAHTNLNPTLVPASVATAYNGALTPAGTTNTGGLPPGLDGSGVTIGLLEVDGFPLNDVSNWLAFAKLPANLINHIHVFSAVSPSGCGFTSPQCGTSEVLLDIAAAMGMATGARIEIFENPLDTDMATAMAVATTELSVRPPAVLSISLGQCEDTISAGDAEAMDVFAALGLAMGISTFAGTGDTGANCGGTPNTISAPSDSPNAVAVGGTILRVDSSNAYNSESWWTSNVGAGGFGDSQYFFFCGTSPCYPGEPGRSVPDVSMEAYPGIVICQPNCSYKSGGTTYFNVARGTSLSTPLWAATWALTLQAASDAGIGTPRAGYGNLYNYTAGLHGPATMTGLGNDFVHVGLGSPNITRLVSLFVPPTITGFNPGHGTFAGGTTVTIHGTGFIGVKNVMFGGNPGTNLTIDSDSKLTVVTPFAQNNANAEVKLNTPGGTATASTQFGYDPEIDYVSPPNGPAAGGTTVTVTGISLSTDLTFEFIAPGETDHAVSPLHCAANHMSCTMVSPPHAPGQVNVRAVAPWGFISPILPIDDQFAYQ
jgi:subtilase family serine protease